MEGAKIEISDEEIEMSILCLGLQIEEIEKLMDEIKINNIKYEY